MHWYDHLEPAVRDVFQELTSITQQDLGHIHQNLQDLGIDVVRPRYDHIDDFVRLGHLVKPEICPRDNYLVVGNRLLRPNHYNRAWHHAMDRYIHDDLSQVSTGISQVVNGANVVRVGRDIVVDRNGMPWQPAREFQGYRVHVVDNGGHLDGCFAILRPGLILANHYFDDYERTFPGWEIIRLDEPTFGAAPSQGHSQPYPIYNGKFWDTTVGTNRTFNQHIIQHALDWVGCYTETYFELNCLVINENEVMMLAENHELATQLARRGIRVHWVPFRARSFWDGAMHCLTVDIRRDGQCISYFPERD